MGAFPRQKAVKPPATSAGVTGEPPDTGSAGDRACGEYRDVV